MTKIYVGNLPFSATEAEIRELFEQHGTVDSVQIMIDRQTNRPRGFGFVEMNATDAQSAIEALDGSELNGRPLRVNEARPLTEQRPERPPRSFGGGNRSGFSGGRSGDRGGDRGGGDRDRGGRDRGGRDRR